MGPFGLAVSLIESVAGLSRKGKLHFFNSNKCRLFQGFGSWRFVLHSVDASHLRLRRDLRKFVSKKFLCAVNHRFGFFLWVQNMWPNGLRDGK